MSNQVSYKNRTNYHHLFEGDVFTLLQLKRKLGEWGTHTNPTNDQKVNYGWNLEDRDTPWNGEIPPVGTKFTLYTNMFFENMPRMVDVVRVNHNLFQVVCDWN